MIRILTHKPLLLCCELNTRRTTMKSRIKVISIASLFIFSVVAFTGCGHWYKHKSPEEKAEWIVSEIQEELDLNDAQMIKLNELKIIALDVRKELKESHAKHHQDVTSLLTEETLDQNKLQSMIDTKIDYFSKKSPEIVQALAGFYDGLTLEQQTKLREEWKEKSEKHRKHHWH